jgi:uncharacterized membrane protein
MAYRIEPVKDRDGSIHTFANVADSSAQAKAVKVKVTKQTDGSVTWLQKLQGYYKGLVVSVAAVLVFLNEITPVASFLPSSVRHWFDVAVVVVGAASAFLVKNQQWVDSL